MHSGINFIEDIVSEICKYIADIITKNYTNCKNIPGFIDVISKQLCNKSKYIKPKL